MKIRGTAGILNEMKKAYEFVERIEKSSKEILPEDSQILETIGYACVHMMNACGDLEQDIYESSNKLEPSTVEQVLDVLSRIEGMLPKNRGALITAFQIVVVDVANCHGVLRNTIADACTRRLQLDRDGFLDLVDEWLSGYSRNLELTFKAHCNPREQAVVVDFFTKRLKLC